MAHREVRALCKNRRLVHLMGRDDDDVTRMRPRHSRAWGSRIPRPGTVGSQKGEGVYYALRQDQFLTDKNVRRR